MRFEPATVDLNAQRGEFRDSTQRIQEHESSTRQPQESFKELIKDTKECLKEHVLEQHKVDHREPLKDFREYLKERTADPMEPHKDSELAEEIQKEETLGQQRQHSAEPLVNRSSESPLRNVAACRPVRTGSWTMAAENRRRPMDPFRLWE